MNVAQGRNLNGSSAFSITGDISIGAAIATAVGTTSFSFTAAGTAVAPINGTGTASILFTATNAPIQASAYITGNAAFSFTGNTLSTYARGFMIAVPIDTALTPDSVASAVWAAVSSLNNAAGTMGEKLNDAGSGSNPWTEIIESGLSAAEILRIILSVQAGKTTINGTSVAFRDLDDTKDRVQAEMTGSERTTIILDGSL